LCTQLEAFTKEFGGENATGQGKEAGSSGDPWEMLICEEVSFIEFVQC
jgi:hypothetical protein